MRETKTFRQYESWQYNEEEEKANTQNPATNKKGLITHKVTG